MSDTLKQRRYAAETTPVEPTFGSVNLTDSPRCGVWGICLRRNTMVKAAPMQAYLPSVLIVDDEPSICDVVADACRQCGLSPLTATSATSAMEILDHQAVDVMVCDLIMADMDGVRLMERCVNRPRAPKMLVMTGYGSLDTAQQAMRLGALDYVLKPFDVQDLARRIHNAAAAGVQSHAVANTPRRQAVLLVDADGRIQYASPATAPLVGHPAGDLAGTRLSQWLQSPCWRQIARLLAACTDGERLGEQIALANQQGAQFPARVDVQRTVGEEAPLFVLEICDLSGGGQVEVDGGQLEWAKRIAITDSLTGLYNHRYFQEELRRMRRYCQRYDHSLSLLMIDIDDFEETNRRFGHGIGDELLRKIAEKLQRLVRTVDLLGRYGGDEFVLLMPETTTGNAIKAGRRLCAELCNERIRFGGNAARITVSAGLATCESGFIETEEELLSRAHEAVKAAKRAGKDRLVTWMQVVNTNEALACDHAGIEQMSEQFDSLTAKLKNVYFESARTLVAAVEAKDVYTCHHSVTVAQIAAAIAQRMGLHGQQIDSIKMAATLHDIGKIGIPDHVLTKNGPLTDEEFALIKQHPTIGASILENASLFRVEIPIIRHHHERWDGKGYPASLAGADIPLGARILGVCDSVDAMLSDRAYRRRLSMEDVIVQIKEGTGTQFDPEIAPVMIAWLADEGEQLYASTNRPEQLPVSTG